MEPVVEVGPYITMMPVAVGPVVAMVPVTAPKIAPSMRPVPAHLPAPMTVTPALISVNLFVGISGDQITPLLTDSSALVNVMPSVEMPSLMQFTEVNGVSMAQPAATPAEFAYITASEQTPVSYVFEGMEATGMTAGTGSSGDLMNITPSTQALQPADFEGVKNEVTAPAMISPPAFTNITPSVILNIPGAVRYFNMVNEAIAISGADNITNGNK